MLLRAPTHPCRNSGPRRVLEKQTLFLVGECDRPFSLERAGHFNYVVSKLGYSRPNHAIAHLFSTRFPFSFGFLRQPSPWRYATKGIAKDHPPNWVWVKVQPGYGPQVLVHVSIRATQIVWLPFFFPPAVVFNFLGPRLASRAACASRPPRHSEATARKAHARFSDSRSTRSRGRGSWRPRPSSAAWRPPSPRTSRTKLPTPNEALGLGTKFWGAAGFLLVSSSRTFAHLGVPLNRSSHFLGLSPWPQLNK